MRGKIYAHDFSAWAGPLGSKNNVDTCATSEVNDYFIRLKISKSRRVTAPSGEGEGGLGDLRKLFLAVEPVLRGKARIVGDFAGAAYHPLAAALLSAREDAALPAETVVFGEISLSGALRPAPQTENRLKEAQKLGFTSAIAPRGGKAVGATGIALNTMSDLTGFVGEIFGAG
mgnify:CR=1 FL=1